MTRSTRRHRCTAAAAAAAATALAACGSGGETSAVGQGGVSGASQVTLTAQNTAFDPSTLSVPAGAQVTVAFTNRDSVTHSLTFDDNSKSVDADGGTTQTMTFTAPAAGQTIAFHCRYHSTMHGTITTTGGGGY